MKFAFRSLFLFLSFLFSSFFPVAYAETYQTDLAHLISALRTKSEPVKSSPVRCRSYQSFLAAHNLAPDSVSYSDFILVRVIFEATRDAGFWNTHWSVTDKPPNSDEVWRQSKSVKRPAFTEKTATAECDELPALFTFLAMRSGVKNAGFLKPASSAVWDSDSCS